MKAIVASLVIAAAVIFGAVVIAYKSSSSSVENVSIENGKQIITLGVKGGYSPRITNAKANMPTILRLVTNNTFDCSSAVSIPALGYRANLPQSGTTEVEIPSQTAGVSIQGTCGMGMYNFKLEFL
jgi:Cu+-exporting ATPase